MPITNVQDLTGFVRRFSCNEGLTDATYGFPYGSLNTATAFNSPGKGAGGSDGWNVMAGAAGGAAQKFIPNDLGGPCPAVGGGIAIQRNNAGVCSSAYFNEGTAGNRPPQNAHTIILCVRGMMSQNTVTTAYDPATLTEPSARPFNFTNFTQKFGVEFVNRRLAGTLDNSTAGETGVALGAQREIIVLRGNTGTGSGSDGNGLTTCVVRNGAIVGKVSSGTCTADALAFCYLGDDGSGGKDWPGIVEGFAICKAFNSDADIITAANLIRAEHEAVAFAPTIQLSILCDSIGMGYKTTNGACWTSLIQDRLAPDVLVVPWAVSGISAEGYRDGGTVLDALGVFDDDAIEAGYSTITRRETLIALGTNDILTGVTAANYIASMNALADRILDARGRKPYAMVPACVGHSTPGTFEAARREYRTALLASTHFAGIIDTDTRQPALVPRANSAYACAECAGSLPFQIPTASSGGLTLPGTLSYNSRAIGIDGIHPGPVGHSMIADMLLRDTESGFAQALGYTGAGTGGRGRFPRF